MNDQPASRFRLNANMIDEPADGSKVTIEIESGAFITYRRDDVGADGWARSSSRERWFRAPNDGPVEWYEVLYYAVEMYALTPMSRREVAS